MITAIFNAIAALPSLVSSIKSLVVWISDQITAAEKRKASADMAKAIELAKKNHDPSAIDHMFDPDKK